MNEAKLYELIGRQLVDIECLCAEVAKLKGERDEAVILAGKHFAELKKNNIDHVPTAHELTIGPVPPDYDPDESCFNFSRRVTGELKKRMAVRND